MSQREQDTDDELRRALSAATQSWQPNVAAAQLELRRRRHPTTDRHARPGKSRPVWIVPLAAACAVAALITGLTVVPDLLDRSAPDAAEVPAGPRLTFTRPDGSTFVVGDFRARCHVSDKVPLITITSPFDLDSSDEKLLEPYAELEAVVADVAEPGTRIQFPSPSRRAHPATRVFALDATNDNELSSAESGSSGSVTFERATCEPRVDIEVVVDATLGSEVDMETVEVSGTLRIRD